MRIHLYPRAKYDRGEIYRLIDFMATSQISQRTWKLLRFLSSTTPGQNHPSGAGVFPTEDQLLYVKIRIKSRKRCRKLEGRVKRV